MVAMEGADNPFKVVDVGAYAAPTFVDNDGDLDVLIGNSDGGVLSRRADNPFTRCTPAPEHQCSGRGKFIFSVFSPSTSSFSSSCASRERSSTTSSSSIATKTTSEETKKEEGGWQEGDEEHKEMLHKLPANLILDVLASEVTDDVGTPL